MDPISIVIGGVIGLVLGAVVFFVISKTALKARTQRIVKEAEDKLEKAGMKFNDVKKELFYKRVEKVYEEYYKKYGDGVKRICEQIKATK